ncbi:MAG: putative outer membrane protein involved in nutrient binding [Mucilaginibacter sp.]|nr:putative outer membrane protein involved in nutrient binding [Mucilaginibacter sp.]
MNMKHKYILIPAVILLFAFLGCKKSFLETKIDTFETPTAAATDRSTLFSFGNAFYTSLQYGFTVLDNNLFASASDEAQQIAPISNAMIFNQGGLNPNNNPDAGLYKTYYNGIRAANFFLSYAVNGRQFLALNRDTINDAVNYKNDIQNLAWYIAEAHIARAYYYSELIKRWGGVPIITSTLQQAGNEYVAKSSYDDVISYIVSEIDNYKAGLQVNWKTSSFAGNDGRFSLGSALAIKARVLLYAASPLHNPANDVTKWQKAAAAAKDVMTTTGLNYSLATSYGAYFTGANPLSSNETIFAVRRPANNTIETDNYPIATPGGKTGEVPSDNLVSDYEYIGIPDPANPYNNRDPRLTASIVTNGSAWNNRTINEAPGGIDDMANANTSKTGYYLKKFLTDNLNLVQGGTAQNQWVVFRYAEILLDYAEAMNEAYGPDNLPTGYAITARQALKMVRDRASTSLPAVTITSVSDFRNAVKHERRIELAFEDHRYWDLLRWNNAATVLNQPITGVAVTKTSTGTFAYQKVNVAIRTFNSPANYYYPFSQAEIANSNGTLKQNPGY